MKEEKDEEFDWFRWADIKSSSFDQQVQLEKLIEEAKKHNVPILKNDKEEDIFNRLLSVKTYKNNKETLSINKVLTVISFVSAMVSIVTLFFNGNLL
jgi:hypothetical protein